MVPLRGQPQKRTGSRREAAAVIHRETRPFGDREFRRIENPERVEASADAPSGFLASCSLRSQFPVSSFQFPVFARRSPLAARRSPLVARRSPLVARGLQLWVREICFGGREN